MFLKFKHTCAQTFIAAPFMRASDVFQPPQLSFQQRSHHYEFWVPQLVGGQKSRSRHGCTFLVKKKTLADEAASSLKHTVLLQPCSCTVAVGHGRCDVFQGSSIKTVKKTSSTGENTAMCQQKLQCIRLRLRRDNKSAKQTSS